MITRAQTEITQHLNAQEIRAAVSAAKGVVNAFSLNVLPHAKTYPLTGFDTVVLDGLRNEAELAIEPLYGLLEDRAKIGDGAALIILYRNLHTLVQCKLMMDRWRHGVTRDTAYVAEIETSRVVRVYEEFLVDGFHRMSDNFFSPGIVHFHAGGKGRPEFNQYSYTYMGKTQPVKGSQWAPVAQAFIEARKAGRDNSIPHEVREWCGEAYRTVRQLKELKDSLGGIEPLPQDGVLEPPNLGSLDSNWWYKIKNPAKPGMALDVVNDGNQERDGKLQMAAEGNFSGQYWQLRPSKISPGAYNLCTMWLGTKMFLDVYGDDKTRPHLATAGNYSGQ